MIATHAAFLSRNHPVASPCRKTTARPAATYDSNYHLKVTNTRETYPYYCHEQTSGFRGAMGRAAMRVEEATSIAHRLFRWLSDSSAALPFPHVVLAEFFLMLFQLFLELGEGGFGARAYIRR
jgi:hypothetical protein